MKIYTKTGDDGTTGLFGGGRLSKSDPRIDCYGTIDELNASLGLAAVVAGASMQQMLRRIQNDLFVIGSHLASDSHANRTVLPMLNEEHVARLESEIDAAEEQLPKLRNFILPGGTEAAARLHVARTICRRAERLLVVLQNNAATPPLLLAYLNRLSDWLFVHARLANHSAGIPDVPWEKD